MKSYRGFTYADWALLVLAFLSLTFVIALAIYL